MVKANIKINFSITGDINHEIEHNDDLVYRDLANELIDKLLKEKGIEAFDYRMTHRVRLELGEVNNGNS